MPYIFLDTSIFVAENFLEGNRIKEFLRLSQEGGPFHLIMPMITLKEIKAQFRKRASAGIAAHKKVIKSLEVAALRNCPALIEKLQRLPGVADCCAAFNVELDRKLVESRVTILPFPVLDTAPLFDKYFRGEKPFSVEGEKKNEFPDAFAMSSIENWCRQSNEQCIILSMDNDLLEYENHHFIIPKDYSIFLSETLETILQEELRFQTLHAIFERHREAIIQEINDWAYERLDDTSLYDEHAGYMQVHAVSVQSVDVELRTYEIISIEAEKIQIDLPSLINVKVLIVIDDSRFAFRDEDDRSIHYPSTREVMVNTSFELVPTLEFNIKGKDEFEDRVNIIDWGEEIVL